MKFLETPDLVIPASRAAWDALPADDALLGGIACMLLRCKEDEVDIALQAPLVPW